MEPSELPNRPLNGDGDAARSATQLTILLQAAMATVDEEFKRSERLDAKSRNQMTLVATMFGIAQAITVGLVNGVLGKPDTAVSILVGIAVLAAIVALGCLAWTLRLSFGSWRLRSDNALALVTFGDSYLRAAQAGNPNVGAKLVVQYEKVLRARREANAERVDAIQRAAVACGVTAGWIGLELVVAFAAVIVRLA